MDVTVPTHSAFTCSKIIVETLEQGVKNILKVNKKKQNDAWRRFGALL